MKQIAFVLLALVAVLGSGVAIQAVISQPAAACDGGCG